MDVQDFLLSLKQNQTSLSIKWESFGWFFFKFLFCIYFKMVCLFGFFMGRVVFFFIYLLFYFVSFGKSKTTLLKLKPWQAPSPKHDCTLVVDNLKVDDWPRTITLTYTWHGIGMGQLSIIIWIKVYYKQNTFTGLWFSYRYFTILVIVLFDQKYMGFF